MKQWREDMHNAPKNGVVLEVEFSDGSGGYVAWYKREGRDEILDGMGVVLPNKVPERWRGLE